MELGTRPYFFHRKFKVFHREDEWKDFVFTPNGRKFYKSDTIRILNKPLEFGNREQIEALKSYEILVLSREKKMVA